MLYGLPATYISATHISMRSGPINISVSATMVDQTNGVEEASLAYTPSIGYLASCLSGWGATANTHQNPEKPDASRHAPWAHSDLASFLNTVTNLRSTAALSVRPGGRLRHILCQVSYEIYRLCRYYWRANYVVDRPKAAPNADGGDSNVLSACLLISY